jgi:hypothetical protein
MEQARPGRAGGRERRGERPTGLGCVVKKRKGQLGWVLREKREKGEKERESGLGPKRKGGRKRNAVKCI